MEKRMQVMWEFERWANRRALESIGQLAEPADCLRLFAHILAAQKVWLTRMNGADSSSVEIFPTRTAEECGRELDVSEKEAETYLESLDEASLDGEVGYTHQSGKRYRNTPRDVLTQLAMHSHYHRGQIAMLVRMAGATPAATDFIFFRRQGQ